MKSLTFTAVLFAAAAATTVRAHAELKVPNTSPAAKISQSVGLTEITVAYHRPAVNGRVIWGDLVPYNETWRAGANENTTVTFSSDVKVGGKPLRAGTYGLHMIPTTKDWTIAFSTMAVAWGSESYDPKEDALRVTVTPQPGPLEERLVYRFDNPSNTKTTLVMAWEKLAVPIAIEVDTPKVTMASIRNELRGDARYSWDNYYQAARYWVNNGGPLDEAMQLIDRSIAMNPNYRNQMARARILEKQGNAKAATELRAKVAPLATEGDLRHVGWVLVGEKQLDEALKVFKTTTERFPESENAYDSYAQALVMKGDKPAAIAAYTKALAFAKDPADRKQIERTLTRLKSP